MEFSLLYFEISQYLKLGSPLIYRCVRPIPATLPRHGDCNKCDWYRVFWQFLRTTLIPHHFIIMRCCVNNHWCMSVSKVITIHYFWQVIFFIFLYVAHFSWNSFKFVAEYNCRSKLILNTLRHFYSQWLCSHIHGDVSLYMVTSFLLQWWGSHIPGSDNCMFIYIYTYMWP